MMLIYLKGYKGGRLKRDLSNDLGKKSDLMTFQWREKHGLNNKLGMRNWRWLLKTLV